MTIRKLHGAAYVTCLLAIQVAGAMTGPAVGQTVAVADYLRSGDAPAGDLPSGQHPILIDDPVRSVGAIPEIIRQPDETALPSGSMVTHDPAAVLRPSIVDAGMLTAGQVPVR